MSKPFKQISEEGSNLLIVDALSLAFRWKHVGATDFYEDYLQTVNSFKRSYKAKYVIIATDQGNSSYRKSLHPEYKATRKEKFEEQTEAEKKIFELFFEDFQYALDHIRNTTEYPVIQFNKTEADDIAAYIVSKLPNYSNIEHTWLLSTDADWDLLLQKNVSRFSYVTRKEITLDNWLSTHDYDQKDHLSIKCLMGDSGDNIQGVPGIGPKRAAHLVKEYGSALDIADVLPISSNLKFIKSLNSCHDRLILNYQLMDLITFCSEALGENTMEIDRILDGYIKNETH